MGRAGGAPGTDRLQGFPWAAKWSFLSRWVVGMVLEPCTLGTLAWLRASLFHLERLKSGFLPLESSSLQTSCMASWESCPC